MHSENESAGIEMRDLTLRGLRGTLVALAVFAMVGTVTAVWVNPFFIRMTPVGIWELPATLIMAILSGITSALWVPQCRLRGTGSGGVLGFLGVACPTCNKILMLIFGGPALLAWFDPVRPYLALAGIVAMTIAAARAWQTFRSSRGTSPMAAASKTLVSGGSR